MAKISVRKLLNTMLVLVFCTSLCIATNPEALVPIMIDSTKWKNTPIGGMAYDPAVRKVYVGVWYQPRCMNLLVFDVAEDGTIGAEPRKYIDHTMNVRDKQDARVRCLLLDTKNHKLFLGVDTVAEPLRVGPLVMYQLDDKGEPSGSPQAFDIGNSSQSCTALALHPKLKKLYAGGDAGSMSEINLDDSGSPIGSPVVLPGNGGWKSSISIRLDGSKIYASTYPSTVQVWDLDQSGNIGGKTLRQAISQDSYKAYPSSLAVSARRIYFTVPPNSLYYVPLDEKGDLSSTIPVKADAISAYGVFVSDNDRITVVEGHTFTDALNGKICSDGVQLREISLKADGAPGKPIGPSVLIGRQLFAGMGNQPGLVLACKPMNEFLGNRFAGLLLRATLLAMDNAPICLPPLKTIMSFGKPHIYLSFVYSPTRSTVYSVVGDSLMTCRINKGVPEKPVAFSCPDASGPMTIDDEVGKLYIAKKDNTIAVFSLKADGTASNDAKTLVVGITPITLLRVNPLTHQLYVFSPKQGESRTIDGVQIVPVLSVFQQPDAVVDTEHARIYGVSNGNGNENIRVWKLANDGTLLPEKPKDYADGLNGGENKLRSQTGAVKVDVKRHRLYTIANLETVIGEGKIVVYTLNEQGDPIGSSRLYPSKVPNAAPLHCLEISRNGKYLYESGWGAGALYVHELNAKGDLIGKEKSWPTAQSGQTCIALNPEGRQILAGSYPSKLTIYPLSSDGLPIETVALSLDIGKYKADFGLLTPGDTSPWVKLDDGLKDGVGIAHGRLTLNNGPHLKIGKTTFKFEVAKAQGYSQKLMATLDNVHLEGPNPMLFLPRYGNNVAEDKLAEFIQTTEMRLKQNLAYAQKYALKPEERPKQFIVGNSMLPKDNLTTLKTGLKTLATLGQNAITINTCWIPSIPAETIRGECLKNGFRHFIEHHLPENIKRQVKYFMPMQKDELDQMLSDVDKKLVNRGIKPDELAVFHLTDEPGWYYPGELKKLKANPEYLATYHDYLKDQGMTPKLLGQASWKEVLPIGHSGVKTLADKRLFYWTMRFFPDAFSRSFAVATQALQKHYNKKILTAPNFNNWPGRYILYTPNVKWAHNVDAGADASVGFPDWFNVGRHKGVTCLWTEDWFGDGDAQLWSLYADLMRCAAREGGVEFGGYVIGLTLGNMENGEGGKYKTMALIGHGAKAINYYTYGPNSAFGDGWSENRLAYPAVAAGCRMLGRSEPLTWAGRPRNGQVAILFSQASQVWDNATVLPMYMQELYGLHAALIHKQYPVDFVDDTDVEEGALQKYGYTILYITAPNLSSKAQQTILNWVKAGGTLVLFPGAGKADEYNEPLATLAEVAGVTWENDARENIPHINRIANIPRFDLKVTDASIGVKGDHIKFQRAPMTLTGAKTMAQFTDGSSAMAQIDKGSGRIFSFGYWPGSSYWFGPERLNADPGKLPTGWSAASREIITAPARLAGTKKYVSISTDLVEGLLLESAKGTAVTLLNWSGKTQEKLTVTIAVSDETAVAAKSGTLTVESLEKGVLKYKITGSNLQVSLPLKTVDVLMIRNRDGK